MDILIEQTKRGRRGIYLNVKGCHIKIASISIDAERSMIFLDTQLQQWIDNIENKIGELYPGKLIITRKGKSGCTFWPSRFVVGGITPTSSLVNASLNIILDGISVYGSEVRYYVTAFGDVTY